MDFISNTLANGRKFRSINIIDQYNRKCLKIAIGHSLPSRKVIESWNKPLGKRTDNGPEFTYCLFQNWLDKNEIEWIKIQKGKPQQNAIVERFNNLHRVRISRKPFLFTQSGYEVTRPWKLDYNEERPHEALNFTTPEEYAA